MKLLKQFVAFPALVFVAAVAQADVIYLDFEGIAPYPNLNDVGILDYYNGGTASNGASGPNFGVEFANGATLLCLNNIGETCSNTSRGDVGIPGSREGAMFFPLDNPIMNVAAGFDTGFSFVYSDPFNSGSTVNIFDDLNGLGNLLTSAVLVGTPDGLDGGCDAAYSGNYCPFVPFGLGFAGVAKSVTFGGPVNLQVFDDFTFGSDVPGSPIPIPATLALIGIGLAGLGIHRRKRTANS